jgi:hemoglobin
MNLKMAVQGLIFASLILCCLDLRSALAEETPNSNGVSSSRAYKAFGEKEGLKKVVNDMMANVNADPRIAHFFAKVDQVRLKEKLSEQFCQLLEGPCTYTGHSMADTHDGLDIRQADFYALVEDLQKAMISNHVNPRAQNQLLAKLAPMHKDILKK